MSVEKMRKMDFTVMKDFPVQWEKDNGAVVQCGPGYDLKGYMCTELYLDMGICWKEI